jgi:hypothetical protein
MSGQLFLVLRMMLRAVSVCWLLSLEAFPSSWASAFVFVHFPENCAKVRTGQPRAGPAVVFLSRC